MSDILRNLYGTILNAFRIGIGTNQIILKNNSAVLEFRNKDDNAYVVARCASPVADNDVANKYYADSIEKPLIVSRQADCTAALPTNTASRGWVVVSTAGTGAVVGDVLYDNGTSTGDMAIVAAIEGRMIAITDALAGGTATFDTDSTYIWDADGSVWVKIGDIGSVTGPLRIVRFAITNAASQSSTFTIPANARVLECRLDVGTAYSAGATISIGYSGSVSAIMATTENSPQDEDSYVVEQDTAWDSSARAVLVTIANTPAAGAGVVIVKFTSPNV